MLHLAHQPFGGLSHRLIEQRIGTDGERVGVHAEQRAVVVQHLFEVRNHPARVGGIAAEAAADVVEDAAARDVRERDHRHLERFAVFRRALLRRRATGECPMPQQPFDRGRHRELRRGAEAAFARVVLARQLIARRGEQYVVLQLARRGGRIQIAEHVGELGALRGEFVALVAEYLRHAQAADRRSPATDNAASSENRCRRKTESAFSDRGTSSAASRRPAASGADARSDTPCRDRAVLRDRL